MSVPVATRKQIYHAVDSLRPEQLAQLGEYLKQLLQEPISPLYYIHQEAIDTGIADLADQHDHYLYGLDKHDG